MLCFSELSTKCKYMHKLLETRKSEIKVFETSVDTRKEIVYGLPFVMDVST